MKKNKGLFIVIFLIIAVVALRMYRKYDRQRLIDEKKQKQLEWVTKMNKRKDSLERIKQDSLQNAKYSRKSDSVREELEKGRKKIQETLKRLEQEGKQ